MRVGDRWHLPQCSGWAKVSDPSVLHCDGSAGRISVQEAPLHTVGHPHKPAHQPPGHYRDGKRPRKSGVGAGDESASAGAAGEAAAVEAEETAAGPVGGGLVAYSSSSEDDDEAPTEAPSTAPPPVVSTVAREGTAAAASAGPATQSDSKAGSDAQRFAALEQSMEDPLKRLKAGKYKSTLLERVRMC